MKLSLISAAVALSTSALAAPTPQSMAQKMQLMIQSLQEQIVMVENDIIQSKPSLMMDWKKGMTMFGTLKKELGDIQPCTMAAPMTPTTMVEVLTALQNTAASLVMVSSDLLDSSSTADDLCEAMAYYMSTSKFVDM